jgi:hypothetical protein
MCMCAVGERDVCCCFSEAAAAAGVFLFRTVEQVLEGLASSRRRGSSCWQADTYAGTAGVGVWGDGCQFVSWGMEVNFKSCFLFQQPHGFLSMAANNI